MMAMLEGDGAAEAVLGLCFGQLEFSELAAARRSAAYAGGRRWNQAVAEPENLGSVRTHPNASVWPLGVLQQCLRVKLPLTDFLGWSKGPSRTSTKISSSILF